MKKTRLSFLFVGFFSLIALFGCSDDNDDNTPIDPSAAKINEVVIVSKDKNVVEIGQTHVLDYQNPRCYKVFCRDPYHPEDTTDVCILQFSCNIAGSKITDKLDIQLQSLSDMDFGILKVGDTWECSTADKITGDIRLVAGIRNARTENHNGYDDLLGQLSTFANSGCVTVVDNKQVDGKRAITLKIEEFAFITCTLSATIQFEVLEYSYLQGLPVILEI